jgi:hypothetical protein
MANTSPLQTIRPEPRTFTAIAAPAGHVTYRIVPHGTSVRIECECSITVPDRVALSEHHAAVDLGRSLDWASETGGAS